MPVPPASVSRGELKQAIKKAKKLVAMLQGTMGLEGQGLDFKTLRKLRRKAIAHLLDTPN